MLFNEEGLDINYFCEDGYFVLYFVVKNGYIDCVRLLLSVEV